MIWSSEALDSSPNEASPFAKLLHTLELSVGFELLPVVVQEAALVPELIAALRRAGWAVEAMTAGGEDWLGLLPWLESLGSAERRLALVHGVGWDTDAFRRGLQALNLRRDPLIRALACPLLWCGSADFQAASQLAMPDLWSVRAVPQRIVGAGTAGALPLRLLRPAAEVTPLDALRGLAQGGDGRPGYVLALVRALLREGTPESLREADAAIDRCLPNTHRYGSFPLDELLLLRARVAFERHDIAALKDLPAPEHAPDFLWGQYSALNALWCAIARRDWAAARAQAEFAVASFLGAGAPRELVSARLLYAAIAERMGDREVALRSVEQAIAEARVAAQPETEADALLAMALLNRSGGDHKRADELFSESAACYRQAALEPLAREVEAQRLSSPAASP